MTDRLLSSVLIVISAYVLPVLATYAQPEQSRVSQSVPSGPPDALRVTILGSGGGPQVNLRSFGPSILVRAGTELLLFDCGRGATLRLTELGVPPASVTKVFLTHLHSDHIIDLPDLYLATWGPLNGRKVPFEVWGPAGTEEMMSHLRAAFAVDIESRGGSAQSEASGPFRLQPGRQQGILALSHEIEEGVVYQRNDITVTAFLVDHGTIAPAFGYRVDYGDRSFAMSGDTSFSENLIKFADGVDLIIHEAVEPEFLRRILSDEELPAEQMETLLASVMAGHTSPEEAGDVFTRVEPRLAVFVHAPNLPSLLSRTRRTYTGRLEMGEDLMTITIGDDVTVHRFEQ